MEYAKIFVYMVLHGVVYAVCSIYMVCGASCLIWSSVYIGCMVYMVWHIWHTVWYILSGILSGGVHTMYGGGMIVCR